MSNLDVRETSFSARYTEVDHLAAGITYFSTSQFIKDQVKKTRQIAHAEFSLLFGNIPLSATHAEVGECIKQFGPAVSWRRHSATSQSTEWLVEFETIYSVNCASSRAAPSPPPNNISTSISPQPLYFRDMPQYPMTITPIANATTRREMLQAFGEEILSDFRTVTLLQFPLATQSLTPLTSFLQVFGVVESYQIVAITPSESIIIVRYQSEQSVLTLCSMTEQNRLKLFEKPIIAFPGIYKPLVCQNIFDIYPLIHIEMGVDHPSLANGSVAIPIIILRCNNVKHTIDLQEHQLVKAITPHRFSTSSPTQIMLEGDGLFNNPNKYECVVMSNLFDTSSLNNITTEEAQDILNDVLQECSKFGTFILHYLHPQSNLYLQLTSPVSAAIISQVFQGREFQGRHLNCTLVSVEFMKLHNPSTSQ